MAATGRTVTLLVALLAAAVPARPRSCQAAEKAASPEVMSAERQSRLVLASLDEGDGQRALDLLRSRALELPFEEQSLLEGRAYLLLGDLPNARRRLESSARDRLADPVAVYWLGRVYEADGAAALAAVQYQRANWNGLATADLHYHWASVLKTSGQLLGEATQRECSEEAAPPKTGEFALGGLVVGPVRANTRRLLVSSPESAVYQVHRALALEPERGDALLLAAEIWAALQRHEEAVAMFAKAAERLQNKKDLSRCHDKWAASLFAMGDFEAYLKHTTERMRVVGEVDAADLARCYARAAEALARRGDLQGQIRYLTLSAELKPDVDRLVELSDALRAAQRFDEAQERLRRAMSQKPSSAQEREIRRRLAETEYLAAPRLTP